MKAKVAHFSDRPNDWSIRRATRQGINGKGEIIDEPMPLKMGGASLSCLFPGHAPVEIGDVFMEFNILWRVEGFCRTEDCKTEVYADSVCSLEDLIELIPIP